jgi:hypothetical protein
MGGWGRPREKHHSDVIARESVRFGLRCYWRRRPSRGEMSPPFNRTGFRPDAAAAAHGPRLRDNQTGDFLIGTRRAAYRGVLQRNTGHPDRYREPAVFDSAVIVRMPGHGASRCPRRPPTLLNNASEQAFQALQDALDGHGAKALATEPGAPKVGFLDRRLRAAMARMRRTLLRDRRGGAPSELKCSQGPQPDVATDISNARRLPDSDLD